jgi:hypothetical protein
VKRLQWILLIAALAALTSAAIAVQVDCRRYWAAILVWPITWLAAVTVGRWAASHGRPDVE